MKYDKHLAVKSLKPTSTWSWGGFNYADLNWIKVTIEMIREANIKIKSLLIYFIQFNSLRTMIQKLKPDRNKKLQPIL